MHAMGPNVAGVIGTAVAAGVMITLLSKQRTEFAVSAKVSFPLKETSAKIFLRQNTRKECILSGCFVKGSSLERDKFS